MVDALVTYAARASDLLVDDLVSMPDPRSARVTGTAPNGEDITIDTVIAYDTAANHGYPSTVGQPFTITVPLTWVFASITRSVDLPAPEPVTPEDIRTQYDEFGPGFPTQEEAEA